MSTYKHFRQLADRFAWHCIYGVTFAHTVWKDDERPKKIYRNNKCDKNHWRERERERE